MKINIVIGIDTELVKSPNAGIPTINVNDIIPRDNIIKDNRIETSIPFLKRNVPITMPSNPVVKRRMTASCTLIKERMSIEEKNTLIPSEIL